MLKKLPAVLLHLLMLAIVCAIATYWVLKIVTPPPSAPPPPVAAVVPREADPVLAARMFGLIQTAPVVASNVQLLGLFAAGPDSSAVLSVDGKPARVVLLGQSTAEGAKLVEVRPDGVTLETNGVRQELKLPLRTPIAMGGPPPPPAGFTREGNTLSAPGQANPVVPPGRPTGAFQAPGIPRPGAPFRPVQPAQPAEPVQPAPAPFQPAPGAAAPEAPPGMQPALTQ